MGMNKGKLKREKKELERIFNQGRYGEFLHGVEREGVASLFLRETEKAWVELALSAFTSPGAMMAFFKQRNRFASWPDLPDLRFLQLLERFLDGNDVADEATTLKNLSPAAQFMGKQLLQWDETQGDGGEMAALFTQFASAPGGVGRGEMEKVAAFFSGLFPWALEFLPDYLENLGKAADDYAVGSAGVVDLGLLATMDQGATDADLVVPGAVLNILLAPLLWRLARLYELSCREEPSFALELAGVTPFLSSRLAGDRWGEVEQLLYQDDLIKCYREDPRYVRKRIAVAEFPDKIRLLRSLATTLTQLLANGNEADLLAQELEQHIRADYLLLQLEVLAEIGRNRSELSMSEQGELTQVMGSELDRAFITFVSSPRECDEFLQGVALAGLLDTKLALTSLLLARSTGNRTLRESAERALAALPPATREDLHWLFKYFGFLSYPSLSAFAPVIRQIRNQETLLELFADLVAIQVTRALVSNQLINFSKLALFQAMKKEGARNTKQEMSEFRDELFDYLDIGAFAHLFLLAESYPEGYVTEGGFRSVQNAQYARGGIVEIITRMKQLPPPPPGMTVMDPQRSTLFGMELRVSLELMKQHFDDLRTVPLGNLATLVEILERSGPRTVETGFLAGLSALLQKRRGEGEEEAGALVSRVQMLIRVPRGIPS